MIALRNFIEAIEVLKPKFKSSAAANRVLFRTALGCVNRRAKGGSSTQRHNSTIRLDEIDKERNYIQDRTIEDNYDELICLG
jgi:hypothetical protein